MLREFCIENLRLEKKVMGNICDYGSGIFIFKKKIKLAFNNYPSIDDGNAFDLKCYTK
jgi:hypothetical protein